MQGKIISVNISKKKGVAKKPVKAAAVKKDFGIVGDAHSGSGRQVSFLDWDEVQQWLKGKKNTSRFFATGESTRLLPTYRIAYGDFAENITTKGIDWKKAKVGDKIKISRYAVRPSPPAEAQRRAGSHLILEITQIGKECHSGCAIRKTVGDCIMPRRGIFAKVLVGGKIKTGDNVNVEIDPTTCLHTEGVFGNTQAGGGVIKVGILTCSDKCSKGERTDTSGPAIKEMVKEINGEVVKYEIVCDDEKNISEKLKNWSDEFKIDLIFTTGGTGLAERDMTPEATRKIIDRTAPGFSEIMRMESFKKTKHAVLSRGISGIRKRTLIINLPGSEKAVRENLRIILPSIPHAVEILNGKTEHSVQKSS